MSASPPPLPPPPPTGLPVSDRGPQLLAVGYTLLATSLISTFLRCYVRLRMVKSFGLDDWFMVAAILSFTFYVICGHLGVIHGTGRHFVDLELDDIGQALLYWWLCTISFAVTMITAKISIALFLLRLVVTKVDTWIIYSTAGFNIVSMAIFAFVAIFQCKPVSFFWNRLQTGGTCIDINVITALTYFNSTLSFVSDFTCVMVALVLVWNLNMTWQKKAILSPILSMGLLAGIAVLARFAYVEKFRDPDFLWATFDIAIWSSMEQGLAITASSLATLRPLVRAAGKKLGHSWWGSEDQGSELPRSSRSNKWELQDLPSYSIRRGFQAGKPFNLTPPKRPERCVVISPPYSPSAESDDFHKYMPPSPEDSISTWYYQTTRSNESEEALTAMANRRMRRMHSADLMMTHNVRIYDDRAQKYI